MVPSVPCVVLIPFVLSVVIAAAFFFVPCCIDGIVSGFPRVTQLMMAMVCTIGQRDGVG